MSTSLILTGRRSIEPAVRAAVITALLLLIRATPALAATPDSERAARLLAATAGQWKGELQYRDYQSNSWQGLPVDVAISAQPDGVTTVRTARYDDGPQTGIVTITTATMIDNAASTQAYAIFRKGRAVDAGAATISLVQSGSDPTKWTIVTLERRKDGNDVAQVRETTTRDGDMMTTLKEVDPVDDKTEWLPRNRSVIKRTGN